MSVHYKFKSALEYDTVTFDGLHISVKDLKNAIVQQKRIGKNTDFDLQVTNAQTKEVYEDENVLIPKNTSLLVARVPTTVNTKSKQWEGYGGDNTPPSKLDEGGPIAKAVDLSSLDAPEDDKIKAMISQSTQDYDPSNYMKIRGANQMGAVPANYRCYKCHQTGHWIKDCPLSKGPDPIEIKKSTGIPLSFMVPVEGPQVQGAMMTPNGSYAVPVLDHQTYTQKQTSIPVPQEAKTEIPEDLLCSICLDLLSDAVMIPCCGNSFCDECIRSHLLDSEEHECPDCHEKDISPATLIPNRFLRNSVANFKNTTGYVKKLAYKQKHEEGQPKMKEISAEPAKSEHEEKTVISEADSTEHTKTEDKEEPKHSPKPDAESLPEGPPGVSPIESPKTQSISKRINSNREPRERSSSSRPHRRRSRDDSPRRHTRTRRLSPFRNSRRSEDRSDTPTVDELQAANHPPSAYPPPFGGLMTGPPPLQSLPPGYANPPAPNYGPSNGPPPNFRLPPPGTLPPSYMPTYQQAPPRPAVYETRTPSVQPPQVFQAGYSRSHHHHHHREYGMGERRMRARTPSGVIDDPLAAFNRMLREKDERERRAKRQRRSYSRSRSRSRSFSRSPRRMRSRSPRRRSRSRSFSISRHRFKEQFREYERPRPEYGGREERAYSRERISDHRGREDREHERDYAYYNFDERGTRNKGNWGQQRPPPSEAYYQDVPFQQTTNRYPPRDYPFGDKEGMPPTMMTRTYEDVPPPGVDEPPIPGLENTRFEDPFERFPGSPKKEEAKKEKRKSPEKKRSPEGNRKSKEKDSPDKHKRKKRDQSEDKKNVSDEEKSRKSRDRKKKKDKKDDKKKKREKREKHRDKKHKEEVKEEESQKKEVENEPKFEESKKEEPESVCVQGPSEVAENNDKLEEVVEERTNELELDVLDKIEVKTPEKIQQTSDTHKEYEDKDILEIHSSDMDFKSEIDARSEMLAHLPEKSKWEVDEDVLVQAHLSPKETGRVDVKDKAGKVTNEVLKRAENAIFAKAINAIRPIEIKKISTDRAKLYSNEKEEEKEEEESKDSTANGNEDKPERKRIEAPSQTAPRVSIKERLGIKIDDLDRIVKIDRNKSRSISPFSRRVNEANRNYGLGERRVEVMDRRRRERSRLRERRGNSRRDFRREDERRKDRRQEAQRHDEKKSERSKSKTKEQEEDKRDKDRKKRSHSRSGSEDRKHRKRDKKTRKEKTKRYKDEADEKKEEEKGHHDAKTKAVVEKRKPTIDEAHFEPDYDLESESEKEEKREAPKVEERKSSSSSDSSDSSSEDDRKKKKHKKHRKKRSRRDSSSSGSESETDSSDDDKDRKRKKHRKKQKKRKKSKHK